jgi:2-amino-4-hydroxy-6-hydroxymethyldihydropteridine diphosphokinase
VSFAFFAVNPSVADEVILGLGANVGDPLAQLADAVARLREVIDVTAVSGVYRTPPLGFVDQPDFYNLVLLGRSPAATESLLADVLRIEQALGRTRSFRNAPRTIDIDILAHGARQLRAPDLEVPHPRLHERAFVLVPLAEVAPQWRHPVLGHTAARLLADLGSVAGIERVGELPGSG